MSSYDFEWFWCPPNIKWADFKPDTAQPKDLYYSLLTAVLLMGFRFLSECLFFKPLGRRLCSVGQRPAKESTVRKFSECLWRLSFYLAASIFGWLVVIWNKPYLYDTMHALYNYPDHPVKSDEWLYYNIELGFYISLAVTQVIDTKRKDFWQMFVHHIVTILLLVLSWLCNFHRLGCLVLAIHDVADVPLEGAKLAKYCNNQRLADLIFAIFAVAWIYTRCYLLPTRILYYTSYKALDVLEFFPAYYIFNGLLCLLQLLHIVWTVIIIRISLDALQNDGMRDIRSDSEESDEHSHKD